MLESISLIIAPLPLLMSGTPQVVVGDAPRVGARTAIKGVEVPSARAQSPEAVLIQSLDAPRRFNPRKGMQSLTEHQFATRTPGKRVDVLVRVAGAKTRKNRLPGYRPDHLRRCLSSAPGRCPRPDKPRHAPRAKPVGISSLSAKTGFFVGPAITIGIFQDQQFVVRHIRPVPVADTPTYKAPTIAPAGRSGSQSDWPPRRSRRQRDSPQSRRPSRRLPFHRRA